MTLQEALDALGYPPKRSINVTTKSGAQYDVEGDVEENCDASNDYVYGFRTNGRIHMRGRRKVDTREQLKWFALKNVKLTNQ